MNMIDIIAIKRDGGALSADEIRYFVREYTAGNIPDYQASALLMAIYLNGMTDEETFILTDAMKNSGDVMDLGNIAGVKVDKHSTGGVGDKITLITAPIAAACGVPVAKMSGRGLGFTGGTVDKLEAIPGFHTQLSEEDFVKQVNDIGIAVVSQTGVVAPADKKIYALRDVTSTVGNVSLIASSIMSKKLASGSDAIVLDIKCGNGAFMETAEAAEELAGMMIRIGRDAGKRMTAVVSDMNQPLGDAVGNALEVIEAIDVLKCQGPDDITELALELAAHMILSGGLAEDIDGARAAAADALKSGAALEKLRLMIERQGGNPAVIDDYSLFAGASLTHDICAGRAGYVQAIETQDVGIASQRAGAGRAIKEDTIDPGAGIIVKKKIGDAVSEGDILMTIYANDEAKLAAAAEHAAGAYTIGDEPAERPALIKEILI